MSRKNQSDRLTAQQKASEGVLSIFGEDAKIHDSKVGKIAKLTLESLRQKYPNLTFRIRAFITKKEINDSLNKLDSELGTTLILPNANIRPDGGIIEVKDDSNNWRIVLVTEAKRQGKDIENISKGIKVGTKKDQDLMAAGNAIERSHKNISEFANYMLSELHFPYIIFLEGSNFLIQDVIVERPDGTKYTVTYNSGILNRLDRLTASNYGMKFNKNLSENKFIAIENRNIMLQAASMYITSDGSKWTTEQMLKIMLDVSETSLRMLSKDLFTQLAKKD